MRQPISVERRSLRAIVAAYERNFRTPAHRELQFFGVQRSFEEAVKLAGLASGPLGKRLHHQRRLQKVVLAASAKALLSSLAKLRQAPSFEALHDVVEEAISGIPGIGELTVYDTALRIGAHLGLQPAVVFLHAGTREGAVALGISRRAKTVEVAALPSALSRLAPHEIEDCLCIYKRDLRRLESLGKLSASSRCAATPSHALRGTR